MSDGEKFIDEMGMYAVKRLLDKGMSEDEIGNLLINTLNEVLKDLKNTSEKNDD